MDMEKIYNMMLKKASEDENFRKELLENAKEALKKIDIKIPDDIDVKVYQSTDKHIHYVLPQI